MSERFAKRILAAKTRGQTIASDSVRFAGGVCTEDPYGGKLGPGALRDAHNMDVAEGGYKTKGGWVRFGMESFLRPLDSLNIFYVVYDTDVGFEIVGAGGYVIPANGATMANFNGSGITLVFVRWTFDGDDTAHIRIYFAAVQDQDISAINWATSSVGTDLAVLVPWAYPWQSGPTDADDDEHFIAYGVMRGLIASACGITGGIQETPCGIFQYKNELYVVNNRVGGTYMVVRRCGPSNDWSLIEVVPPGNVGVIGGLLYFRLGRVTIAEGATITGATSGSTVIAYRVVVVDGSFEAGDARGFFSISDSLTGGFAAGEVLNVGATAVANAPASGTILEQVRPVVGTNPKFRCVKYNFSGFLDRQAVYFVTGTGYAYEFCLQAGKFIVTPIASLIGITDIANWNTIDALDKPINITAHRNTLFLIYTGGSVQNSASGEPLDLRATTGFDEKQTGEEITNLFPEIGGSLLMSTKNNWWAIYGDTQQNYDMQLIASEVGALADAGSNLNGLTFIDRDITTIQQAANYGNWSVNSISRDIHRRMQSLIDTCTPIKTIAVRNGAILRFLFAQTRAELAGETDAPTLWVALKAGVQGSEGLTFGSYNRKIIDACEGEMVIGTGRPETREVFFIASDGYVYRDETICVADDVQLESQADTALWNGRSPGTFKHWQELFLDISCQSPSDVEVTVNYHDFAGFRKLGITTTRSLLPDSRYWDIGTWDSSTWNDGRSLPRFKLYGLADAISLGIRTRKLLEEPTYLRSARTSYFQTEVRRHR